MWSKHMRQRIARSVSRPLEACWAGLYRVAGWLTRPERRARAWHASGHDRIVIVAAHPDDETIGAGGVAVRHLAAGDTVTVVVVTDGRASRAGGLQPDEMARRRAAEVADAARLLGIQNLITLNVPEPTWQEHEVGLLLAPLLQEAHIIYAPSCIDFHPDHRRLGQLVATLVSSSQTIRIVELGVPLTGRLVNLVADISQQASVKELALKAFTTQRDALRPLARLARYRACLFRQKAIEVFWELPGEGYERLMREGAFEQEACPFFGIRAYPLLDPWCTLSGHQLRTRLRKRTDAPA